MTAEQRAAALAKAAEARRRPRPALRRDFLDADHWAELARLVGKILPAWDRPCTSGVQRRWLARVGVTTAEYLAESGDKRLGDFRVLNPDWPARACVGMLLDRYGPQPAQESLGLDV